MSHLKTVTQKPRKVLMTSIFNYNTLEVSLDTEYKSIHVNLARPQNENAINFEMLFELETLFSWISGHIEINSILLSGKGDIFSSGIDEEELVKMSDEKLQRFLTKMQKLTYSLFYLPQTIIADLKSEANNIALELACAADIRIISDSGHIQLDYLEKALVPCCGGISFLSSLINTNFAKNWILTGDKINSTPLMQSGFVHKSYSDNCIETRNQYLQAISKQAPIARIQAKRSLLETHLRELDKGLQFEKEFAFAGMCTRDWENAIKDHKTSFTSPKDLAVKLNAERNSTPLS